MEPYCGEAICRLFPPDENVDLTAVARKAKRALRDHRERMYAHGPPPRHMDHPRLGLSVWCADRMVKIYRDI